VKARLWNSFTNRRERTIELDGLPNPEAIASVPPHEVSDGIPDGRDMLRELGFTDQESEFYIAYVVEEYALRELPERLCCSKEDVERIRARVNRKKAKFPGLYSRQII
jgi:hypothetical protein